MIAGATRCVKDCLQRTVCGKTNRGGRLVRLPVPHQDAASSAALPDAVECEQDQADQQDRPEDEAQRVPAAGVEHLARNERGDGDAAEEDRHREGPAPCSSRRGDSSLVTIAVAPMKPKFQPTPSRTRASQKCHRSMPRWATMAQPPRMTRATGHDPLPAEAADQPAGEEARDVHRQHMPLDAEGGHVGRMPVADHRQRRAGHHEGHQRVGADGADESGDETRLADDLRQRACRLLGLVVDEDGMLRYAQERQHRHADEGERHQREKGAGEHHRSKEGARVDHRLRPDDARRRRRRPAPAKSPAA